MFIVSFQVPLVGGAKVKNVQMLLLTYSNVFFTNTCALLPHTFSQTVAGPSNHKQSNKQMP